ncbi:TPR-like protein [Atractiella rhizophila]|nr:TPR-like protein [Atractiella rhizophila]
MVELSETDWENEFAKFQEEVKTEQQQPLQQPEQWHTAEELVNLSKLEEPGADPEIEKTWNDIQSMLRQDDSNLAEWEKTYGSQFADHFNLNDSDHTFGPISGDALITLLQTNVSKSYPYSPAEQFKDSVDPYLEAVRMMDEGKPLREVAAALEEACRRDEERGEAWELLGRVWAMDEKETLAINAFERAVLLNKHNAWIDLAISYVNEGADSKSVAALEKWLSLTYPDIAANFRKEDFDASNPWAAQDKLSELYIEAARRGGAAGTMDKLVQVGLGVLFYSNSDYQKAKDCFEAALAVDTQDYALWNRMGATLANGGEPELAIDAYRKALELRPTFTRAIYNLGVSCLNINCPHEAAEHLLAALELQKSDVANSDVLKGKGSELLQIGDGSENLWATLRKAFLCMGRHDLADRAQVGGDIGSFRKDGFEF